MGVSERSGPAGGGNLVGGLGGGFLFIDNFPLAEVALPGVGYVLKTDTRDVRVRNALPVPEVPGSITTEEFTTADRAQFRGTFQFVGTFPAATQGVLTRIPAPDSGNVNWATARVADADPNESAPPGESIVYYNSVNNQLRRKLTHPGGTVLAWQDIDIPVIYGTDATLLGPNGSLDSSDVLGFAVDSVVDVLAWFATPTPNVDDPADATNYDATKTYYYYDPGDSEFYQITSYSPGAVNFLYQSGLKRFRYWDGNAWTTVVQRSELANYLGPDFTWVSGVTGIHENGEGGYNDDAALLAALDSGAVSVPAVGSLVFFNRGTSRLEKVTNYAATIPTHDQPILTRISAFTGLGPEQNVFGVAATANRAAAEALLAAYDSDVANATWLASYNANLGFLVLLQWNGGSVHLRRNVAGTAWEDATNLVKGVAGANAWRPLLAVVDDGDRRVVRILDWVGGTGAKPSVGYFGPAGVVAAIADATDLRGGDGGPGGPGAAGWSPILSGVSDGDRRVFQVSDWVGGGGNKPTTGQYIGAAGLVDDIADATDYRGAAGAPGVGTGTGGGTTAYVAGTVTHANGFVITLSDFTPALPDPVPDNAMVVFNVPANWAGAGSILSLRMGGEQFNIVTPSVGAGDNLLGHGIRASQAIVAIRTSASKFSILSEFISDNLIALRRLVRFVGGTFTGLVSGLEPVAAQNFATKSYVDNRVGLYHPAALTHTRYAAIGPTAAEARTNLLAAGPLRTDSNSSMITIANSSDPMFIAFGTPADQADITSIRQTGNPFEARAQFTPDVGAPDVISSINSVDHKEYVTKAAYPAELLGGSWTLG